MYSSTPRLLREERETRFTPSMESSTSPRRTCQRPSSRLFGWIATVGSTCAPRPRCLLLLYARKRMPETQHEELNPVDRDSSSGEYLCTPLQLSATPENYMHPACTLYYCSTAVAYVLLCANTKAPHGMGCRSYSTSTAAFFMLWSTSLEGIRWFVHVAK